MHWPLVGREAAFGRGSELIESGIGVALLGPAGVGKSRLLHELAEEAGNAGMTVINTVASVSTRSIPFGPFVELLPGGPTPDRLAMLGAARAALAERSGSRGLLLCVDDAHHLDEASLAFLGSVVASRIATVVVTARTGEEMASDLVDLWTNGVIERLDLAPLERSEVRDLLTARLGAVTDDLEAELWRLAAGNPLVLHELIEGAVGTAITEDDEGVWTLTGSVAESARLSDLVSSRLGGLTEDVRMSMDVVAVGSPLPLPLARTLLGDALVGLEEADLVQTTGVGADAVLVPTHPLYGEILGTQLGGERRRAAFRRLALAALDSGDTTDPLRVASWQRDCGEILSPEIALSGAGAALMRHDPGLAEELVRPLPVDDPRVVLLLGSALSYQRRFDEAEAVLRACRPGDDGILGEVASIRAQNLAYGLRHIDEARSLLEDVAGRIADADLRARLINERATISAIAGDFADSMRASELVLSQPDTSTVPVAAAYVTLTVALAMTGDCDRMDEIIDHAVETTTAATPALPFARDQVGVVHVSSQVSAGRIAAAVRSCDEALGAQGRGNAMTSTWLSSSVMALEYSGRLRDARDNAIAALEQFAEADPFGLELQARGLLAITSGQLGEAEVAASLPPLGDVVGPRVTVWLSRGRAWLAAAGGDLDTAVADALDGGREAVDGEHTAWASFCFSDVVRFGRADLVLDDLRSIDSSRGAHFLEALREHAEVTVASDPDGLRAVAGRFVGFGSWLLAAEAFAQAAALAEDAAPVAAATDAALSMAAEMRCQDARTPALAARPTLVTPREIEVALDAARGLTSPEIAEARFISARTVDNHLSSVYRKCGLSGRDELSALLAPFE